MPLSPYPSPEQRDRELRALAGRLRAEVVVLGHSVEGRPLLAVRRPRPGAARVLVCGNIHGLEFISNRVAMGFLSRCDDLPAEVWVVPCLNPDGYAATWAAGGQGTLAALRTNAHGVDLNRNFPMPWGARPVPLPGAGSLSPEAATWRGAAPASEPEVASIIALMERIDPVAGANLHAFFGAVIPPRVRTWQDHRAYVALAAALRSGQPRTRYRRIAFPPLDVFTGEQEDYQHHVCRTWAVCVESFSAAASFRQHRKAPSLFWRFNPHDPAPWVDNDAGGLRAYFAAALQRARPLEREGARIVRRSWV